MNPWVKRSAIALGVTLAVGASAFQGAVLYGDNKMQRVIALPSHTIPLLSDNNAIDHGRYLYQTRGCADCHGNDGGGRVFIDDPASGMHVSGPNISQAFHSPVAHYHAEDWERTIRHGVKPNGQPLMVMPSEEYARLSDEDLTDLVAYVRQLPAVSGVTAQMDLPPLVHALYAIGVVQDAAEKIDHSLPNQQSITPAVNLEYGEYLAQGCKGCHGPQFSGGSIPGAPPAWPAAANLTPGSGSALLQYEDAAAFKTMLRSGKRPDGSAVSPVMPFTALAQLNDQDMEALYLYLHSLPARSAGQR